MKRAKLLIALLSAAFLATQASAKTTFVVTALYTYHIVNGNVEPYTPMVGEPYDLAVEYDVVGGPAKAKYTIRFTMGEEKGEYQVDFPNGHGLWLCNFQPPLDGSIPIGAEIDPYDQANGSSISPVPHLPIDQVMVLHPQLGHKRGNKLPPGPGINKTPPGPTMWSHFTPRPPSKSIEMFNPQYVLATQSMFFDLSAKATDLTMMVGTPENGTWMKILKDTCKISTKLGDQFLKSKPVENPSFAPVYFADLKNVPAGKASAIRQTWMQLFNLRVDADALRKVTWEQMDAAQGIKAFHFYTHPEDTKITQPGGSSEGVIENNSPVVADFVNKALGGADFRKKYTPYDAARKVFMAMIKHVQYTYPKPGQPDLRPKDAVGVIEKGLGDCGGYSIALVACFRHMGIPARTSYGAWLGQDAGHCWAELYFPQNGWILADGSSGNSMSPDGKFAYYFGNSNNQNARYACARINTFNIGESFQNWLQGPSAWATGANIQNWDSHTFLMVVPPPPAGGYGDAAPQGLKVKPMMFKVNRPRDPKDPFLHSVPDVVYKP